MNEWPLTHVRFQSPFTWVLRKAESGKYWDLSLGCVSEDRRGWWAHPWRQPFSERGPYGGSVGSFRTREAAMRALEDYWLVKMFGGEPNDRVGNLHQAAKDMMRQRIIERLKLTLEYLQSEAGEHITEEEGMVEAQA